MQSTSAVVLLILAACLFGTFFANVMLGAAGKTLFLSDISELLILFGSCVAFVAATLQLEKRKQRAAEVKEQRDK
jgi:hypothetical protein